MPVAARRLIRKMRGGAQAHLVEAADGNFYVVKFLGNPQHRRVLINELIASHILRYLQIAAPEIALIEVTSQFLLNNPDVFLRLGTRTVPIEPGWHFGSQYPGDPATTAVYDFVPDSLLGKINNLPDFLGCLVFDKWTGNADGRQAVFFRAPLNEWLQQKSAHPLKMGFFALMIDHGFIFNGPHWDFPDSPAQGLYLRPAVYHSVTGLESFQPWLDRVIHFPDHVIDRALRELPPAWVAGEENPLEEMLKRLLRRGRIVPDLIEDLRGPRTNPFPNWRR